MVIKLFRIDRNDLNSILPADEIPGQHEANPAAEHGETLLRRHISFACEAIHDPMKKAGLRGNPLPRRLALSDEADACPRMGERHS